MKLNYIFKFLFLTHNGKLRLSFLFPITGILVGSYIIFITYSIMNGLAISIDNKLGSFDYKYSSGETDISIDYYNDYENFGAENICLLKSDDYEKIVKIKYYNNMNHYYDKIESFLIYDNAVDVDKGIIIGDELALALNAGIGDSISILLPSQINLSTNYVPNIKLKIINIFNYDLFEYDNTYAMISLKQYSEISRMDDNLFFYADEKTSKNMIKKNDLLIGAVNLEKKIYTSLSFLLIFISCVMIFNIMIMILIEKNNQLYYINILGLTNKKIIQIIFIQNSIISLFFTIVGYFLANLTIYLNFKYNYFNLIFSSLPFKILPMNIELYTMLTILFFMNLFIVLSSTIPYLISKRSI